MAKKIGDIESKYSGSKDIIEMENKLLNEQLNSLNKIFNVKERTRIQQEILTNNEKLANEMKKAYIDASKEEGTINKKTTEAFEKRLKSLQRGNTELEKSVKHNNRLLNIGGLINNQLLKRNWLQTGFVKSLIESDKAIRQTILSLGMSGSKAEAMRTTFENSAQYVTMLGGNLADVGKIMTGFADETGRARVMTAQQVQDIMSIGKGTGLGVENATKLAAQFELIGLTAGSTKNFVQLAVDESERMGTNTTKVLKNINDNFKRLNTYTFQSGAKGLRDMSIYAEKMKIDMTAALNAADAAKSLEKSIDLAAQLQVMGGEFAKTDPFEMLFLSRNDPAKFTEKISDMTKGVVSFRKMADGSFEKFISPADRDRLASVAKSLGMEASQLTEIAQRTAEIQRMRQQMLGTGLSGKDKELVEGAAIFNEKSGKFGVEIAGHVKDIGDITSNDLKYLKQHKVTLEQRAKDSQDFETALKSVIEQFKSILLPVLRGFNVILEKWRPAFDKLAKFLSEPAWIKKLLAGFGVFLAGSMVVSTALKSFGGSIGSNVANKMFGGGSGGGKISNAIGGRSKGALAKGQGMKSLGQGAGIGAAAVGIGAGIAIAAEGISKLADSMSKLTPEQAGVLKDVVKTLAWFMGISVGLVAAVVLFGGAASASAGPLLAFGGAVALIGVGIGVASAGIGFMASGLAELVTAGAAAGPSMFTLAGGIGAISLAMMGMTFGLGGVLTFSLLMNRIAKHAPDLERVGNAFKEINAVMSGNKENFAEVEKAINSISKMNVGKGSGLADLLNVLKNPIKVEFADKKVAIVSDITLNIDGFSEKFKINQPAQIEGIERMRRGLAGA